FSTTFLITLYSLPRLCVCPLVIVSFFFKGRPPSEIYTLSLHDALPISGDEGLGFVGIVVAAWEAVHVLDEGLGRSGGQRLGEDEDRKSTRLNSSHVSISYAVFCLKKKKQNACKVVTI